MHPEPQLREHPLHDACPDDVYEFVHPAHPEHPIHELEQPEQVPVQLLHPPTQDDVHFVEQLGQDVVPGPPPRPDGFNFGTFQVPSTFIVSVRTANIIPP